MTFIGVIGSRRRNSTNDLILVRDAIVELEEDLGKDNIALVSGGCPKGADNFAELLAKQMGLSILIHYPDWTKHGKAAGFVRNGKIAGSSDVLIACVADDRKGGTEDTIKKFLADNKLDKLMLV